MTLRKDEKKKKERPKENSFRAFLKKRAPIYLAVVALVVVFVIPEFTKGTLENSLPELADNEQKIVDVVMKYNGPNESGLTVMDAIAMKIEEEYPNEKIYEDRGTVIDLQVTDVSAEEYQVVLNFKSQKGEISYDWNVNTGSEEITSNNSESKYIINLVDFYD